MGRHGQPPPPWDVPWDLLAWGGFATSTAAVLVWWMGMRWTAAVFVAATGLLTTALIAVLSMASSGRRVAPREAPREPDRTSGP